MSFIFPMTDLSDFSETVTLLRPQTGWSERVGRAMRIHPGRSETGFRSSSEIPHIKIIWFLPDNLKLNPARGDRIVDSVGRNWIIIDPIPYERFSAFRCRCIHETLSPGPDDYVNLYRVESLTGQSDSGQKNVTLLDHYVPAILHSQKWDNKRHAGIPIQTVQDEIVFWIKSDRDPTETDIVRWHRNGALYEIVSLTKPPIYSDWGILKVRRLTTDHARLNFPKN